jgi:hypothetical protein
MNRGQTTESKKRRNSPGTSFSDSADLPKIQLLIFSGAHEDWPGFANQFRYTVHENPRIDDCKRLMYLRSCLTRGCSRYSIARQYSSQLLGCLGDIGKKIQSTG